MKCLGNWARRSAFSIMKIKMKKVFCLFSLFCLTFSLNAIAADVEVGVSQALAEYRADNIGNVKYTLWFNIPKAKNDKIHGHEILYFTWKGNDNLQIDFKGDKSQFDGKCTINGRKCNVTMQSEHIVIPRSHLRHGANAIELDFTSGDKSLNRSDEYLYTLFVPDHARSVFPCFDQPDIKARFTLSLSMPREWKAISNGAIRYARCDAGQESKKVMFAQSDIIPTYLFSFTAGKFFSKTTTHGGYEMEALYRETDMAKVAQLDKVFEEIALSLHWLEDYTGIRQPFRKYGFVVLPGYQFGGMEHPGAIQFRDQSIFLGRNPTPDEELNRLELLAHETAHLWFGDLVTMRWFNDVWTKEVFANFMASKISRQQFHDINHDLNFLKIYQSRALETDRTDGTHPIQQPLDNLKNAGLLYGNIIYDKAPVMMRKLEELMGAEAFRRGLQSYLKRFSYANATWDDLIDIFDKQNPGAGIRDFSEVWVKQKGLPTIITERKDNKLIVKQTDPYNRGLCWKQKFNIGLLKYPIADNHTDLLYKTIEIDVRDARQSIVIPLDTACKAIVPNCDGRGYGRFVIDSVGPKDNDFLLTNWSYLPDLEKYSVLMTVYENYLMHNCSIDRISGITILALMTGNINEQIESTLCDYANRLMFDMPSSQRYETEKLLFGISREHPHKSVRTKLSRILYNNAMAPEVVDSVYNIWKNHSDSLINEHDYMRMAYHLAIMKPQQWRDIISIQRARLSNPDVIREFDFVSRACNPSADAQLELFRSLLNKENRAIEPWASQMLALLNTEAREPQSNQYITPALDALQEIQRTGDIFFPGDWLYSLLSGHKSKEARWIVNSWIAAHTAYPIALINKLKENAYYILNGR